MGHSMTADHGFMYMFGGKTDGYSCADTYIDTLNLGSPESGRIVYPCVIYNAEVNELWSFDLHTYEWVFLNATHPAFKLPPPRQQHAVALVGDDLYVFGGKTDLYISNLHLQPTDNSSSMTRNSSLVLGDTWRLTIPHPMNLSMTYNLNSVNNTVNRTGIVGENLAKRYQVIPIPQLSDLMLTINGSSYAKAKLAPHPLGIAGMTLSYPY